MIAGNIVKTRITQIASAGESLDPVALMVRGFLMDGGCLTREGRVTAIAGQSATFMFAMKNVKLRLAIQSKAKTTAPRLGVPAATDQCS